MLNEINIKLIIFECKAVARTTVHDLKRMAYASLLVVAAKPTSELANVLHHDFREILLNNKQN